MLAIFILAVISILIAGMASYTVYTSIQTSTMLTMVGRNASQMDGIAAALRSSVRAVASYDPASGTYATRLFLPTPDVDAPAAPTVSFVPSWVMTSARTPWGAPYAYCAYAPAPLAGPLGAGAASTPLPYASDAGGATPSATRELTAPDGSVRSYMVSGARPAGAGDDAPAPPVLGFVVSPPYGSDVPPSCAGVTWRGGIFRAAAGSVVAITDDAATRAAVAVPAVMTRYASADGGGDGGSPQSPATLSDVVSEWKSARPAAAVVHLAPGSHALAASELDLAASERMSGRSLRLAGAGATIVSAAPAALSSDADLTLDGVSLGAGVSLRARDGARFKAYNAQLRYVMVDGAEMLLGPGASVSASPADVAAGLPGTASIDVVAGRLTLREAGTKTIGGTMPAALSVQGGFVSLGVGALQASGTGATWAKIGGGSRIAAAGDPPPVTWNGASAPSIVPAALLDGAQRTVETECDGPVCAAQCMAQPGAGDRAWFALSGSCQASGASVAIAGSGSVPTAEGSGLPTDWQCRFASMATSSVPAPPLPASPGTATAICAPVPVQ